MKLLCSILLCLTAALRSDAALLSPRQAGMPAGKAMVRTTSTAPVRMITNVILLAWDWPANTVPDGFNLYMGTNSGAYFVTNSIGLVSNTAVILVYPLKQRPERFWFVMTTVAQGDESLPSKEVHWPFYPKTLIGFDLQWEKLALVNIEQSGDLHGWSALDQVTDSHYQVPALPDAHYFRIKAAEPLSLAIAPVFQKDPRDLP